MGTTNWIGELISSHGTGGWQTVSDMERFAEAIIKRSQVERAIDCLVLRHPQQKPVTFQPALNYAIDEVIFSHDEFIEYLDKTNCSFVYDATSRLYFICDAIYCDELMCTLYKYYTERAVPVKCTNSDSFLYSNLGMVKRSAMIFHGTTFSVPRELHHHIDHLLVPL